MRNISLRTSSFADLARLMPCSPLLIPDNLKRLHGAIADQNQRCLYRSNPDMLVELFDEVVTDERLRGHCKNLFVDCYYGEAILRAYSAVEQAVKKVFGAGAQEFGARMMGKYIHPPYTELFKFCMSHIRNHHAHSTGCYNAPLFALQSIGIADFLLRLTDSWARPPASLTNCG